MKKRKITMFYTYFIQEMIRQKWYSSKNMESQSQLHKKEIKPAFGFMMEIGRWIPKVKPCGKMEIGKFLMSQKRPTRDDDQRQAAGRVTGCPGFSQ